MVRSQLLHQFLRCVVAPEFETVCSGLRLFNPGLIGGKLGRVTPGHLCGIEYRLNQTAYGGSPLQTTLCLLVRLQHPRMKSASRRLLSPTMSNPSKHLRKHSAQRHQACHLINPFAIIFVLPSTQNTQVSTDKVMLNIPIILN